MEKTAEMIAALAEDLREPLARLAPLERCRALAAALEAVDDLKHEVAVARGSAVKELVARDGATSAARQLGVSRNRVYMLMRLADDG